MNLIITHNSADFDAIASSLLLVKIFKNSRILKPTSFEEPVLNFIKQHEEIFPFIEMNDAKKLTFSSLIFSDCDKNNNIIELLARDNTKVLIFDHHSIKGYGSNVSLIYHKYKNKLKNLNKTEALLAILGIYQDTGNLTYKSTQQIDFEASSYFLKFKPDIEKIPYYIKLFNIDLDGIKILHKILENGIFIGPPIYKVFISFYYNENYYYGYSLLLNHLINLLNLKMIFVIFVYKNKIFITGRSNINENINIFLNEIKRGKGHSFASTRVIRDPHFMKYYRKLRYIITNFIFNNKLSYYLKYVNLEKLATKKEPLQYFDANITLWKYFDYFSKCVVLPLKYDNIYISKDIYKFLLPETVINPVLLHPKERKKHPISTNIKNHFEDLVDSKFFDYIKIISMEAHRNNINAFLVGGVPRDMLLAILYRKKHLEFKEMDIVVVGSNSIEFAKKIHKKINGHFSYYKDFKTATIKTKNFSIDFATARREIYERQGALPRVQYTDLFNDLSRRDFTINSIAINISRDKFGEIIDYFGGQRDIRRHLLRILHPKSFFDDPTRILRLIRFKNSLNFNIEKNTEHLLKFTLNFGIFESLKGVRITRELRYLFDSFPVKSIIDIKEYGLLFELFNINKVDIVELTDLNSIINWFKIITPELHISKYLIFFSYLFRQAKKLDLSLFIFKRKEMEVISAILQLRIPSFLTENSKFSTFYKHFGKLPVEAQIFVSLLLPEKIKERYLSYLVKMLHFKPLISGQDCINLGFKGEKIGKILEVIKLKQLDGYIKNKKEAIKYINQRFKGI